jgi:hypothetical protein
MNLYEIPSVDLKLLGGKTDNIKQGAHIFL